MKLSSLVNLRKEYDPVAGYCWRAYWRGTNNRIQRADGQIVPVRIKQADLKFDLLNNPMENGVKAYQYSS